MDKKDEQAIDAVRLYFERGLSQAEVAAKMGISRPTVAKLLLRGREAGFVTVEIHDPRETSSVLGEQLAQRFGLVEARVVHGSGASEREILDDLGRVGAGLVESLVEDGMSVGVSWGRTMNAIASRLRRTLRRDVEIVQLKGGSSHSSEVTNDFEVMRAFCETFNAIPRYLPLPVIFEDVRTLEIVRSDPY
ncbi:sugar-binding transcriptional regulator, partial [Schaalia turicensis]|uniref:sugar-binding transcriptional regulator n=1 Tax=Schaalia turicensis TaxID=131111 RepID=UPI0034A40070